MTIQQLIEGKTCPCGSKLEIDGNKLRCPNCGFKVVIKE